MGSSNHHCWNKCKYYYITASNSASSSCMLTAWFSYSNQNTAILQVISMRVFSSLLSKSKLRCCPQCTKCGSPINYTGSGVNIKYGIYFLFRNGNDQPLFFFFTRYHYLCRCTSELMAVSLVMNFASRARRIKLADHSVVLALQRIMAADDSSALIRALSPTACCW